MRESQIDVPVALIFFNRPEQFAKVFETVKKAAPSRLFLIQDGARENHPSDIENIQKCREVLKGIDWECDINEDFSDENLGCGKRIFTGLTKCFDQVDRLIILEDDCLPSQSFFPFCKELLEKYKDDDRVGMITGMNHLNTFDEIDSDYFFAETGSIAGWATWKHSWELTEYDLSKVASNKNAMHWLEAYEKYATVNISVYHDVLRKKEILDQGKKLSSWSTQFGLAQILNSKLILVPKVNLMSNIGLTPESANSVSNIKCVPRAMRKLYQLKLFELEFPLKHPEYVVSDLEYCRRVSDMMFPKKRIARMRKIESIWLRLIHGDVKSLFAKLKKKISG